MNRFLLISITLATAVLTGCDGDRKAAQARLDKARAMYEKGEFFAAKNEIDSLRTFYPKEVGVLKEGLTLMRKVEISEAERNIAFCDSLLPIKQAELETLKKGFVFEKDSLYEEIGNYIWKQQTIERNVQRCYVRCGVSEEGEMYLASVYYGARPIEHTGIRLSLKDGQFATTASIPYDGGLNYRFKDMGNTTEVVTYASRIWATPRRSLPTRAGIAWTPSSSFTTTRKNASRWNIPAESLISSTWRKPTSKRS